MIDFSMILMAGLATTGMIIFGWLFLKEKNNHQNTLRYVGRIEEECNTLNDNVEEISSELKLAKDAIILLDSDYKRLFNQKKSSEVRVGKIGENLAPFLDGWPYDPNSFRFLGNPIDGIQFAEDKIRFVEIKTGKARLSASQKWIKDLVLKGKVSFVTFRVGEDGCHLVEDEIET